MNKKINVIFVLLLLIISIFIVDKTFQNDTFYAIKTGEAILKNGIDMIDHFSIHNIGYCYEHWLDDILIYFIYSRYGFTGLYISNMVFTFILGLCIYFASVRLYKNNLVSFLITILSISFMKVFIASRAQMISYILFVLEIYFIEMLIKKNNKKYFFYLIIDSVLIANIHAAVWPFYFILFLPYIATFIIANWNMKIKIPNKIKIKKEYYLNSTFRNLILAFLLCIIVGFINPNCNQCFTYVLKIFMGNTLNWIGEHQSLVLYNYFGVLIYLLVIILYLIFTKYKIELQHFFLLFGLIFLMFQSTRHMAFFLTIGAFSVINLFSNLKPNNKNNFDKVFLFIIMFCFIFSLCTFINNFSNKYVSDDYPKKAASYINKNIDKKKMILYNNYNYGSYLILKDIKVFIDSRADLYTLPFNKKFDISDEFYKVSTTGVYKKTFKKYHITHALIEKNSILDYAIRNDLNYKVIYSDQKFILYENVQSINKKFYS